MNKMEELLQELKETKEKLAEVEEYLSLIGHTYCDMCGKLHEECDAEEHPEFGLHCGCMNDESEQ